MSEMEAAPRPLHVYLVHDCDWIVATDEADALEAWREHMRNIGEDPDRDRHSDVDVEAWPDDQQLQIDRSDEDLGVESAPCGMWAEENGRGFLCTSEV